MDRLNQEEEIPPSPSQPIGRVFRQSTVDFDSLYKIKSIIVDERYVGNIKCIVDRAGKLFACKVIQHDAAPANTILREAVILRHLAGKPNIVKLLHVLEDSAAVYFILEYCKSGELGSMMQAKTTFKNRSNKSFDNYDKKRPFTEQEAKHIFRHVLLAIEQCHSMGILHRDVNPNNFVYLNKRDDSPLKLVGFERAAFIEQSFWFVKYSTTEEADRAIAALHHKHTLTGAFAPLQIRYADADLDCNGPTEDKLFVASLNKRATEPEIAGIFASYGHVVDVFLMKDDFKQSRGCGFVRFASRDMAAAAMHALHGTYRMRGCDQPLIVRFADPKRPRPDPSVAPAFGGPGFGHRSEASTVVRPTSNFDVPMDGLVPNAWGPGSPQPPSSLPRTHGFDSNSSAKGGSVETSSAAVGAFGDTGGPASGSQPSLAAAPLSQQGFNPSMAQINPVFGQQMPPPQKPLTPTPQHMQPSLQPHNNQHLASYSQGQALQARTQQLANLTPHILLVSPPTKQYHHNNYLDFNYAQLQAVGSVNVPAQHQQGQVVQAALESWQTADGNKLVKLFIGSVPRTTTEEDDLATAQG